MSRRAQTLPQAASTHKESLLAPNQPHHTPNRINLGKTLMQTQDHQTHPQTLTLTIPMAAELINLNQRYHWAKKGKMTKAWRQAGKLMARHAGLPKGLQRIEITAYVHKDHNQPYDAHNLIPTGKAIVDGLVDYGLVPDDNNAHLVGPDMRPGAKGKPRITLEIRVLQGAAEAGGSELSAAA